MPYYSPELIQQVADANDIVEVISQYVPLKKRGRNYVACCPFHNEKTPSFSVDPQKKYFYCFGCHEGGNIYTFIQKKENISFPEAVEMLANRANIDLPKSNNKESIRRAKENQDIYKLNANAGNYFYKNLKKSKKALGYLVDRGLNRETIFEFGLGYSNEQWSDLLEFLKSTGESEWLIKKAGLAKDGRRGAYDLFRDRLMIPIQNVSGKVIAFGGRKLSDSDQGPKYLNSPDTPVFNKKDQLFNLNRAKAFIREEPLVLVEGYMDVIALYSYGIKNTAAALGTAFTEGHSRLISHYTKSIILCFDGDSAGEKATDRALNTLSKSELKISVIRLPIEHDPDSYIRENGVESFRELIKSAVPANEYRLKRIKDRYDLSKNDQIIEYIQESGQFIRTLSPVEQELYIKQVAETSGIALETVKRQIESLELKNKQKVPPRSTNTSKPKIRESEKRVIKPHSQIPRELIEAQNVFLSYCLGNPDFPVDAKISDLMLVGNFYKWLFNRIKDLGKKEPTVSELTEGSENEQYKELLDRFLTKRVPANRNMVNMAVDVIKRYYRQREIARLEKDLNRESDQDQQSLFDKILDLRKKDYSQVDNGKTSF